MLDPVTAGKKKTEVVRKTLPPPQKAGFHLTWAIWTEHPSHSSLHCPSPEWGGSAQAAGGLTIDYKWMSNTPSSTI